MKLQSTTFVQPLSEEELNEMIQLKTKLFGFMYGSYQSRDTWPDEVKAMYDRLNLLRARRNAHTRQVLLA